MSLTLRPYRHSDANVITTWIKSEYLMRQWCADRYERFPVTPEDMNSYHQQYFDGHNSVALTMVDDEDIVGYISIRTPADYSSEQRLGFVIIDDSRRGKGLGKAIVSIAVDYAFSKLGAIKVSLGVFENNPTAVRCYESVGFHRVVKQETECYDCLGSLDDDMKEAYSFLLQYRDLIDELGVCVESVTYLETLCKREGFGLRTNALCQHHIIRNLIGNATNRRACVGLRMLDYFKRQAAVLNDSRQIRNISSDIIESEFGILKSKVSPNKLNGFTPMILMLPLYPKIAVYSDAKKQNFKVRLANVKLKDIDLWAKENLSPNRVVLRSRTLNNAS